MKRKEPSVILCRALVSLIGVLMIGFLGLGVRAFATADTAEFIFFAASVISVGILILYFALRRPIRNPMAHAPFREPPFVKRSPFPRLCTIGENPLTLDHLPERASRASLAVVKTEGDSLIVSAPASPTRPGALIGLEIPVYEANRCEERVKAGGILLSVPAGDSAWTKRVKEVLARTGTQDIASTGEADMDYAKNYKPLSRAAAGGVGNS